MKIKDPLKEYYFSLEDFSKKYNIMILIMEDIESAGIIPVYNRVENRFECYCIQFPTYDVFFYLHKMFIEWDVSMRELVEQTVQHELNHIKDLNHIWKYCKEYLLKCPSICYTVSEICTHYLIDFDYYKKWNIVNKLREFIIHEFIWKVKENLPYVLQDLNFSYELLKTFLSKLLELKEGEEVKKLKREILRTALSAEKMLVKILENLIAVLVLDSILLNLTLEDLLMKIGLEKTKLFNLLLEVRDFIKDFLIYLDLCKGVEKLINIFKRYFPEIVIFEELYSQIFAPPIKIINLSISEEDFWKEVETKVIKVIKP